jgi:dolichyl-diphosphooligosaccharide--protein glycosyltransferase
VTDDRTKVYQKAIEFCESQGNGKEVLKAVLAVDNRESTWEFSDVELDSGTFGEVVDSGLLERVNNEYQVVDQAAVRAAIEGEEFTGADESESGSKFEREFDIEWPTVGGLLSALVVVVAARMTQYSSVFQHGRVVSPGNDPYFFRYWQEQLLAESSGPLSLQVLVNPPWDDGSWNQRPLTHATNWWFAELLGGGQWAADMVAAWLPIAFTLVLAIIVYYTALVLTKDHRVGITSVLTLALAPLHVTYTELGALHHRSHQFLWFGIVLLTLAILTTDIKNMRSSVRSDQGIRKYLRQRKTWFVAATFGLAFAFYIHSWGGSADLAVALGLFVGIRVCLDVRDGISPGGANLPILVGLGIGAIISLGLHFGVGWHGPLGPGMAALAFVGSVVVVCLAEFWRRYELRPLWLLIIQPVIAAVGIAAIFLTQPRFVKLFGNSFGTVLSLSSGRSTQVRSLFSVDQGVFFLPLIQIGVEFYVALAVLVWCIWLINSRYEPGWLVFAVLSGFYLIAGALALRFAARLVIVLTVLGGLGTVYLLSTMDLTSRPLIFQDEYKSNKKTGEVKSNFSLDIPNKTRTLTSIFLVGILIFGLNLAYIPTSAGQVTYDTHQVEAAMVISDHADDIDRDWPDNYVFAPWGDDRMYNYFVSGESKDDGYARYGYQERGYRSFITDEKPDQVISELPDARWPVFKNGRGYVVVTKKSSGLPDETIQTRLYEDLGQGTSQFDALSHYQLIHVSDDRELVVFSVVQGATIKLSGISSDSVNIRKKIHVSGVSFVYEQNVAVKNGRASVTVPYSGDYIIAGKKIPIESHDIEHGETITVDLS